MSNAPTYRVYMTPTTPLHISQSSNTFPINLEIMPSLINETNGSTPNILGGHAKSQTRCHKPMVNSGSLNKFSQRDLTPIIGREFEGLQVRDLLKADGQLIKDLAITS